MLAFIDNLSFGELLQITVIVLLLYGGRLPEIVAWLRRHAA